MDAHSRGRADEIDPADQWVLNPQTGNYELRLDHSAGQPQASQAPSRPRGSSTATAADTGYGADTATATATEAPVPGQRRRRLSEQGGGGQQPPASRRKRKQGASRKKKVLLWTGGTMAFVLVGGATGAYMIYQKLDGNIGSVDVGSAAVKTETMDGPLNILILGNDVRVGEGNESYGNKSNVTGHADTTFLIHISEDRTNATALSIPRDLKTEIPDCPTKQPDKSIKVIPGSVGKTRFNESFGVNGRDPGCTMRTITKMSGIGINHFMMVDFNAVKTLSTAVGGVKVCLTKPIRDTKYSKLNLDEGEHRIQGEDALAFLRNRHGLGNESDLDRIKMQQQFLASMMRQLKEDTLDSPTQLLSVANAATEALTVDNGIGSALKLTTLAQEIGKVDLKNISFMTVPVVDNPDEPPNARATVVLDQTKAPQVFSMIENDVSFTEVKKKEKDAKDAKAQAQAKLLQGARAKAVDVRVDVYNGSGITGAAQSTINWLQNDMGVSRSTNKSNAPEKAAKTTLTYAPNQADQARKLADMMGLPATALKPGTQNAGEREPMTLVLGADFKGAGVPIKGPTKAPDVDKVEADKKVCAE
ncbi:LCP family protein [Streptomyces sp. NBC_00094]|uniref:LCP family protein n=1 Tax=Streptomyces sp. NBC_00094 TaxID=2903620 RepID=UPI002258536D|nr:LCP family protein [Streptomyces sp. NBC_00094]MCX5391066.1 LCP family protein [Streptomyces sp. NBC_00094]